MKSLDYNIIRQWKIYIKKQYSKDHDYEMSLYYKNSKNNR